MPPLDRLVDANRNRAAEGLRVMEDLARFVLEEGPLGGALKAARHDLAAAVNATWDASALLRARCTAGDPGTCQRTDGEGTRTDTLAMAQAAAGRATEALRALEEAAKVHRGSAERFEAIRYSLYDHAAALMGHLQRRCPGQWPVCLILDTARCRHPWHDVADAALAAGVRCLQIREKAMADDALLTHASAVVKLAHAHGAAVIMNDRPDLAMAAQADGVHVGRHDMPVAACRRIVGHEVCIGATVRTAEAAKAAAADGADYVGIGPAFASSTKPDLVAAGVGHVAAVAQTCVLPYLVIGGITQANVGQLTVAGVRGIALCDEICAADDPGAAAASLTEAMQPVETQ